MTPEERAAAWNRCAELRGQLELLLRGALSELRPQQATDKLREELDRLEDQLAVDLLEQELQVCTRP